MKVALIHYWFVTNRGGEAVIRALVELFPHADLYCHVYDKGVLHDVVGDVHLGKVYTTFIGTMPFAKKHYQKLLPFMPRALENLDLTDYDVVICNESGPTKGVITRPDALQLCYCLSPMRYIWDMQHQYQEKMSFVAGKLFSMLAPGLRAWDVTSSSRVDRFVSISSFVAKRVKKYYRRNSRVIFPPVNTELFNSNRQRGDFYLCLGQLVAYKEADLAVEAFAKSGRKLIVVGEGELMPRLQKLATPNIQLLGRQDFSRVKELLETCKALVFPGVEDFGIVPVEAMASGAPVIARGRGGAVDTVIDGETGIFFHESSVESLNHAIDRFESEQSTFVPEQLARRARLFDISIFKAEMLAEIQNGIKEVADD